MFIAVQTSEAFNLLCACALGPTKLSFIFFYRRIFRGSAFNIVSRSALCFVVVWAITKFFLDLFQCNRHIGWLSTSAKNLAEHCIAGESIALFDATVDVATDLFIIILPLYWVCDFTFFLVQDRHLNSDPF